MYSNTEPNLLRMTWVIWVENKTHTFDAIWWTFYHNSTDIDGLYNVVWMNYPWKTFLRFLFSHIIVNVLYFLIITRILKTKPRNCKNINVFNELRDYRIIPRGFHYNYYEFSKCLSIFVYRLGIYMKRMTPPIDFGFLHRKKNKLDDWGLKPSSVQSYAVSYRKRRRFNWCKILFKCCFRVYMKCCLSILD